MASADVWNLKRLWRFDINHKVLSGCAFLIWYADMLWHWQVLTMAYK